MASFSVVSNIASANAQANLQSAPTSGLNKALNRLSSGFRINMSGDDAAGLAVANSYRNDVAILEPGHPQRQRRPVGAPDQGRRAQQHLDAARPSRDAGDAGGLGRRAAPTSASCRRGVQRRSWRKSTAKRRSPASTRRRRTSRCSSATTAGNETISSSAADRRTSTRTASASPRLDVHDAGAARRRRSRRSTTAIGTLGGVQSPVGTLQNRLQFAISLAQSQVVNKKAAESRIRDANIAEESANMTRFNILSQTRHRGPGAGEPGQRVGPLAAPVDT